MLSSVPQFRLSEAAALLGVSEDTVRRLVEVGTLPATRDAADRRVIDGVVLAEFSRRRARAAPDPSDIQGSERNRLVGLVTSVVADLVMAQVEIQCGPDRVVSLISNEAVRDLGLEPGVLAIAVIKSTHVLVETPNRPLGYPIHTRHR
jgi:molybdopterin-binding protein